MRTFQAARISALRAGLGISRAELARKLEVARSTIWTWEEGKHAPDARSLLKLSELTGGRVESFFAHRTDRPSVKRSNGKDGRR